MMRKAGGIIALVAGIFGTLAAIATLFFGGLGAAVEAEGAATVIGLGWVGRRRASSGGWRWPAPISTVPNTPLDQSGIDALLNR